MSPYTEWSTQLAADEDKEFLTASEPGCYDTQGKNEFLSTLYREGRGPPLERTSRIGGFTYVLRAASNATSAVAPVALAALVKSWESFL